MCNACGNVCCGSDMFGRCGCDGCDEPECWTYYEDEDDDGDDYDYPYDCACRKPSSFECAEAKP